MPSRKLPKRAGPFGPRRPVFCDVPCEVIALYRDALTNWDATPEPNSCELSSDEMARIGNALAEWANPMRPGGGVPCPPSPVPVTPTEAAQ
ncbi:hypothetical protein OG874_42910 [Nocardia sp. NBC_00565]|uniref:hypothetical protein n=1 Tax=Nocardia sp. NBC_00565 TaxID=2975993 RepID=UPI002E8249BF|nr:hypothetical protein [Nocardia sp. NBC_00565]WUC03337.1 hypothetical protein OG874_42910 [Nocardia sp. NBC_00565]